MDRPIRRNVTTMPHLFLSITAHGYGHFAQSAPVVTELRRRHPGLRLTVQARLPTAFIATRLAEPFAHLDEAADVGPLMASPLQVRWAASLAAYHAFHADWPAALARQQARYAADPPDLVLADIPWLPLAAARAADIPAVALCSLNWLDILRESPCGAALDPDLAATMAAAYGDAELFLRPAPTMPMAWLPNARDIGPIARRGQDQRTMIRARLGLDPATRLVVRQFGGIPGSETADWPAVPGVHWLIAGDSAAAGPATTPIADLGLDYLDALASADLLLTKPGYGSFTEAACHGLPVLYVPRGDWPEEPYLVDWLHRQVPCASIDLDRCQSDDLATTLHTLLAQPRTTAVASTGIAEACDLLAPLLDRSPTQPRPPA